MCLGPHLSFFSIFFEEKGGLGQGKIRKEKTKWAINILDIKMHVVCNVQKKDL
jgi:hypothetical protein